MRSSDGRRTDFNRATGGIHGCGFCGDYHDYGSGIEAASRGQALGSASAVAHWIELRRQLSVCCHFCCDRYRSKPRDRPEEIADLPAFMVSPAAKWMTGTSVRMD